MTSEGSHIPTPRAFKRVKDGRGTQVQNSDAFATTQRGPLCDDSHYHLGLRRLASAVLVQGLEDLARGDKDLRTDAVDWIEGRCQDGFDFDLCCRLLDRDPEDVRERLRVGYQVRRWAAESLR